MWKQEITSPFALDLVRLASQHRFPLSAAFIINLLAYGYLCFTYIYTNHIFPNIFDFAFPTNRTILEGRWGADLIYFLQGGKGIPLLDLMLAIPIQIGNGILFARLLNARDPFSVFTAATLVSIHPFVADYYGFGGDHLVLVLGDLFMLSAFVIVQRQSANKFTIPLAAFFIHLGIACYQPKISLLATLLLLITLSRISTWDGTVTMLRQSAREIVLHGLSIALGVTLYLTLFKFSQWWLFNNTAATSAHSINRLHTNSLAEMLALLPSIFTHFSQRLFAEKILLTPPLQAMPGIMLVVFALIAAGQIYLQKTLLRYKTLVMVALLGALCLLPVALYASFIVSAKSYWWDGRFFVPFAYLTAFLGIGLLTTIGTQRNLRQLVVLTVLFFCYRFTLVNADLGHLAYLRTTYELHFVNRLTARIEEVIIPAPNARYTVVVIGNPPIPAFLHPLRTIQSNLNARGFIHYRQSELLNFFLGRDIFSMPTRIQVQQALDYAAQQNVWPEAGSVTVHDEMVIIILEPVRPDVRTTFTLH